MSDPVAAIAKAAAPGETAAIFARYWTSMSST